MDCTRLMDWLEAAAACTEGGPGVTRQFLTPEHRRLLDLLARISDESGLDHWLDDSGNYRMRRSGTVPGGPTMLLGSHQDTVRQGGRYDGILGVLLPLAVLQTLPPLDYDVEVVAFGDEEGTRFGSTLMGSGALAGSFDAAVLEQEDDAGVSMAAALRTFGLRPEGIAGLALAPERLLGYLEVHIEQGPVLESRGLPVGVVSAITGIERHRVTVTGRAGHAGTTPMTMRDDALVKAARIVAAVDELCRTTERLVGVVGKLMVTPNAVNVIPGQVDLTVELRSPDSAVRAAAAGVLADRLATIPGVLSERIYSQDGIRCDGRLTGFLERAVSASGVAPLSLFSGAGHDGLAMAAIAPCAMLFVRCRGGLSHHPDESVTPEDCAAAMDVLARFLIDLPPRRGIGHDDKIAGPQGSVSSR